MAVLKIFLLLFVSLLHSTSASDVDPSKCQMILPDADRFAGEKFEFILQAKNSNGEYVKRQDTSGSFSVTLRHEDGEEYPQTITFPSDITYHVEANLTKAGQYEMVLLWESTPIPDSGTLITVKPGEISEWTSYAFGDGLAGGPATEILSFGIQAVDLYGNEHLSGNPGFQVEGDDSEEVQLVKLEDNDQGQTLVQIHASVAGTYTFTAKTSTGKSLAVSPIDIVVTEAVPQPEPEDGTAVDPEKTTIFSPRLTNETAGNIGTLFFEARNTAGDLLPLTHEDGHFTATVVLPSGDLDSKQIYLTAAGYQFFTYRYNITGTYILLLSWQGNAIPANGTELNVFPSVPSAGMSYLFGENLGSGLINTPMEFGVQAVDEFGNYIHEGDPMFDVQITNEEKLQYFNVSSNQEGQTLVQLMATEASTFQVTVKTQQNTNLESGTLQLIVEDPNPPESNPPISEPESEVEPEPEPETDPVPEPEPEADPVPEPETDPVPEPEPEADPVPEPETDPVPEPEPEADPVTEPEDGPGPEQDPNEGSDSSTEPQSPPTSIEEVTGEPEEPTSPASESDTGSDTSSNTGLSKTAVILITVGASVAVVVVVAIVLVRNRRRRS